MVSSATVCHLCLLSWSYLTEPQLKNEVFVSSCDLKNRSGRFGLTRQQEPFGVPFGSRLPLVVFDRISSTSIRLDNGQHSVNRNRRGHGNRAKAPSVLCRCNRQVVSMLVALDRNGLVEVLATMSSFLTLPLAIWFVSTVERAITRSPVPTQLHLRQSV